VDSIAAGDKLPVFVWTIDPPAGRVLVDTGMIDSRPEVDDMSPTPHPENIPRDVACVINTHLHYDHCGGNRLFLGLPILVGFLIYYRAPLQFSELVWFPVVVLVQLLLTLGIALIVSALTVHFRDLKDILSNLVTFWFFATPIIYSMQDAPPVGKTFLNLNPFTHLAVSYQEILFYPGNFGPWKWLVALGFASALLFLAGYYLFNRLRDTFAEEV